ncbi:MAG TPA: hypothetical protein VHV49_02540 [Pseudonocardiaceae bacterium]|jgi:hypothetical protein|nr:hypothetical protein [Pseudonocardiaceae bacterium]
MTASKQTGLGWTSASIDDSSGTPRELRPDFTTVDISTPRAVIDVTGLDKLAFERLLGLADITMTFGGLFDTGTNMLHETLSDVASTSVARTTSLEVASQVLAAEMLFTDYPLSRDNTGAVTIKIPASLADGTPPEWTTS